MFQHKATGIWPSLSRTLLKKKNVHLQTDAFVLIAQTIPPNSLACIYWFILLHFYICRLFDFKSLLSVKVIKTTNFGNQRVQIRQPVCMSTRAMLGRTRRAETAEQLWRIFNTLPLTSGLLAEPKAKVLSTRKIQTVAGGKYLCA